MPTNNECVFSPDRLYRYTLWRVWDPAIPAVQFIGLNPSTADETQDDPTVRRCIGYAKRWGYGALCMTNLFGFRATDPKAMKAQAFPIDGSRGMNDFWLIDTAASCALTVAAWGSHGSHAGRSEQALILFGGKGFQLHHLGLTASGEPRHPLYLRGDLTPTLLEARAAQ